MSRTTDDPQERRINLRINESLDETLRRNASSKRMTLSDYVKGLIDIGLRSEKDATKKKNT